MTQEQLASALNLSTQAISKWECSVTYPDILTIPVLANIFGVATDVLFDYDATHVDDRVTEVIAAASNYFFSAPDKCEEMLTSALRQYPNNVRLMTELVGLWEHNLRSRGFDEATFDRAVAMAEAVIAASDDIFCECAAKESLSSLHVMYGDYDTAKKLVASLPDMFPYRLNDRMRTSAYLLRGHDRLGDAKSPGASDWKIIEIQELYIACAQEAKGLFEVERYGEALSAFGQAVSVIELFMRSPDIADTSYLWGGMQTHHWANVLGQAGALHALGRDDECCEKIERARYILAHAWSDYESNSEYYAKEFRKIYAEYRLDEVADIDTNI